MSRPSTPLCASCGRDIAAHFAGRLGPRREQRMREHLSACSECRETYERHLLVSRLDPQAPPAQERLATALGLAVATPHHGWRRLATAATVASALVLAGLFLFAPGSREALGPALEGAGFTPKGGAVRDVDRNDVTIYRIVDGQRGVPLVDTLPAQAELAVAYRNPASKPYLMVFAVDDARRVYWLAPAWTDPHRTPWAVSIRRTPGLHEHPVAVTHRFAGRTLWVYTVFLDGPSNVREVETLLARLARMGAPLPIKGAIQKVRRFEVIP